MTIQQASAIPFRSGDDGPEVCLITSQRSGAWGFPKGVIDPGETTAQAALKEAFEEAGLHGEIVGPALGRYRYEKWGQQLEVEVLLMAVDTCDAQWSEQHLRKRRWVPVDDLGRFNIKRPPPKILDAALRTIAERCK